MAWLYRYANGGFTLTPGIGVAWSSQKQNDYYYGVSRRESARSGLKRYKADDGWAPYLEVSANYTFASNWGFTEPHVTAIYLMKLKTLPWWISHGMDCFSLGSLIVSDTGMT